MLQRCMVGVMLVATASATPTPASADDSDDDEAPIVVLRAGQSPRSAAVDAELLRALEEAAGLGDATMSPIQFSEARLSVGCSADDSACLYAIAQMLEVPAVMVRRLRVSGGQTHLTLTYLDASAPDEPLEATSLLAEDVGRSVEGAVRRLFGLPVQTLPADSDGDDQEDGEDDSSVSEQPPRGEAAADLDGGGISPWVWVTLGAGTTAFSLGLVLEILANDKFDEYVAVDVRTRADADHANDLLDAANGRRTAGVILMIAGGAALAVGATLLTLSLLGGDDSGVVAGLVPVPSGGAQLVVAARTGGGR